MILLQKNTRLLDREFIPKTEHLDLNFLSKVQLNFGLDFRWAKSLTSV